MPAAVRVKWSAFAHTTFCARVPYRRPLRVGLQLLDRVREQLRVGADQQPLARVAGAQQLEVEGQDRLAAPVGALVRHGVPGADQPLVIGVGVAVLLVGAGQEQQGPARLEPRLLIALTIAEHSCDRRRVVRRPAEPGVVVTGEDDELVRPVGAGNRTEDVVSDAAVLRAGELDERR